MSRQKAPSCAIDHLRETVPIHIEDSEGTVRISFHPFPTGRTAGNPFRPRPPRVRRAPRVWLGTVAERARHGARSRCDDARRPSILTGWGSDKQRDHEADEAQLEPLARIPRAGCSDGARWCAAKDGYRSDQLIE